MGSPIILLGLESFCSGLQPHKDVGEGFAPANGRDDDNAIDLVIAHVHDPGVHHAGDRRHNDSLGMAEKCWVMGMAEHW